MEPEPHNPENLVPKSLGCLQFLMDCERISDDLARLRIQFWPGFLEIFLHIDGLWTNLKWFYEICSHDCDPSTSLVDILPLLLVVGLRSRCLFFVCSWCSSSLLFVRFVVRCFTVYRVSYWVDFFATHSCRARIPWNVGDGWASCVARCSLFIVWLFVEVFFPMLTLLVHDRWRNP